MILGKLHNHFKLQCPQMQNEANNQKTGFIVRIKENEISSQAVGSMASQGGRVGGKCEGGFQSPVGQWADPSPCSKAIGTF